MAGMCAIFMAFAGQFAFFTYIRPVYMTLAGFDVDGLTLVLLSFGIASFIGTSPPSVLLERSVKAALAIAPLVLTTCAVALVLWGKQNRRLDGGDYLGLRVCADPGGVVNVDHPFALRSGGKSRVDSGGGDPAGQHLRRRGRRRGARPLRAAVAAGVVRNINAVYRVAGGDQSEGESTRLRPLAFCQPALPRVRRLTARRRCACRAYGWYPAGLLSRSPAKRSASRERSFDNAIASEPRLKHSTDVQ